MIVLIVLAMGFATPSAVYGLNDAQWLYVVEQPVAAQSEQERRRAATDALLVVLTRLSGLISVPRNEQVQNALAVPSNYYDRFVFFSKSLPARAGVLASKQMMVRFTFSENAVQSLLDAAGLPVWWKKRPKIMAWLVLDNGGGREILDASSQHPIVEALRTRASYRGLEVVLPLMDLDDNLAVSAADVWGKVGQSLDQASQRYGTDLVLVGRVSRRLSRPLSSGINTQPLRGDWEVWLEGQPIATSFGQADAWQAAELGVDMIAGRIAERYAVLPRPQTNARFAITGLTDASSYAAFMRYLKKFEFIGHVGVTAIDAKALRITLASRAQAQQLLMLLTAEQRLLEDRLYRGLETQLVWQG